MAQPTSRKKYYLSVDIKPEWIDSEFLHDLQEHVESNSLESVRDIFVDSERIGCFSVKTKEIADRILATFETVNVSCCGRKPISEINEISNGKFQIKLRNMNNVMSSNEFESWVLSLKVYTFDIHLFPTKIEERDSCNECILSFDTIDAAISVKQSQIIFHGVALYFKHWHVPRRITYPKEGFVDHQNSGYSSATSSTMDRSNGPLYLRDANIPRPPQRSPPSPPSPPNTEQSDNSNNSNSLRLELKKQQLIIEQLVHQNKLILNELNQQKDFNKCINDKYGLLYKKYISVHNQNTVLLWNADDIIQWVTNLENGWFLKYKYHLLFNMTEEKVTGSMLSKLNATDWHRLGVVDMNDQYLLLRHIDNLIHQ